MIIKINGKDCECEKGEYLLTVARRNGIIIPTLCNHPAIEGQGCCRVCIVEVFEKNKGKLPWPVRQGTITEHFGIHRHPVYKNLKLPECNGVTFTTGRAEEVFSVFDGVVKQIVVMPGYDQCVLIQHGTYFTFYCKLGKVAVKSGQTISRGQKIGTLEPETKNSSSLHFQIWNGTVKQNPENWLVD